MRTRALIHGVLIVLLLLAVPPISAQEATPDPVLALMSQMSAEAKVGQLVLVSFPGTDVGDESQIAALIREFWIGGVLLRPQNGNFGASRISASDVVSMTNRLQQLVWDSAQPAPVSPADDESSGGAPYIPMLVAVTASLDGIPVTSYITGTTNLPSPMSLGASWDRALVETTGATLGRELSALGMNLFLGPNLDVLYTPRPGDPSDLGANIFGSDPFWVGELGKAYIQGLHKGSSGRLLVVPRHLPGLGSADRSVTEEVPTVQKPLEQLKQIELAPFFAVARDVPGAEHTADGFLVTHIRYRGFQGTNIRPATRPISLDAQALQLVMNLPEFAPWRQAGGVLISDNLGLKSIHNSYDPRGLTFNARRVTQDALIAGNDILTLDRFAANSEDWDAHFTNVRNTLSFLATQYKNEATFRDIVDAAVYRILSMKMRLSPEGFSLESILVDPEPLSTALGVAQPIGAQVALSALTRIFPMAETQAGLPPQEGQLIVIFTQERFVKPYEGFQAFPQLSAGAMRESLLRFYGPDGTDIVRFDTVQSFTFEELQAALIDEAQPLTEGQNLLSAATIRSALKDADWIVFVVTGLRSNDDNSLALKTFLAKQANLVTGRIVVFAFGPPYELDSTEISKLDQFYALYSPGPAFVDVAARALFGDVVPQGASPVDIAALDYYILQRTMPDPNQLISMDLVNTAGDVLTETEMSNILKGGVINLRTAMIMDRNGHPVPDGTQVQFVLSYPQEGSERTVLAETRAGVAVTSISLDREGQLDITVQAEPAISSVRLQLTIREEGPVEVTSIAPTPTPTPTATPIPTRTPTPIPTPTPEIVQVLPDPIYVPVTQRASLLRWGIGGACLVVVLGFMFARERELSASEAVRVALWGGVGSLSGYLALIVLGRWWRPSWLYGIIGREFVAGAVAVIAGSGGLLLVLMLFLTRRRKT